MPLDARIPLQAIGIQAPDVLGAMAQGQQYRQNQMAMQAAQTTAQRNAMIRQRAAATDFTSPDAVNAFVREAGPDATPYLEAAGAGDTLFSNRATAERDATKFADERRVSMRDFLQREVGSFLNDPSDANIAASRARAIAQGIDAADFDAYVAPYVALPEGDRAPRLRNELGTTAEGRALVEMFANKYEYVDTGGAKIPVQMNTLAPGAPPPRALEVTADPTKFTDFPTPEGITRVYGDGRSEILRGPTGAPLTPAPTREERQDAAAAAAAAAAAPQRLESARNLTRLIDDAAANTNAFTAGLGSITAAIPGTPAADLAGILESIKSNLAFDRLQQMRDESRTGGALGQIVLRELDMLASVWASTQQSQSPPQLRENLGVLRERSEALVAAYQAMVDAGAGGGGNTPAPSGPARVQNDADFARLPSGATFIGPDGVTRRKP